jgi:predicted HD superfamily hydrolase involved in NAD metabolism
MEINLARKILKEQLSPELFLHCCGVESIAAKLAAAYGADEEKASLAGLLHDYGKKYSHQVLAEYAIKNGIAEQIALQEPALLHAPVGAFLLQQELGINDQEILEAVRRHTTGGTRMTLLDKIVYLADYIEPERDHPGVYSIRKIAFHDLTEALLGMTEMTVKHVFEQGKILHPDSIAFRNSLILQKRPTKQELQAYET